jgi:hypothetical protein
MNLKENIKSVSIFANQEQGDIQVDFVVSEELFNKSMIVIEKQLQEIYVPLPVCGAI